MDIGKVYCPACGGPGKIARDWRGALRPAVASALLGVVSARMLLVPGVGERCRATEYLIAAQAAATRQDGSGMYDALSACIECLIAHADAEVLPPSFGFFARDFSVVAGRLGRTPEAVGTLERLRAAYPRDTMLPQVLAAARAPLSPPLR